MKFSIQRILFPTDFSEPALEAQQYALALAERVGAELHVLHVVPLPVTYPEIASPYAVLESDTDVQLEAANERLSKLIDPALAGKLSIRRSAVVGVAVDEILKYAEAQQIDLIVVGTHGHTGLSRLLIGSVAEKVVRLSKCPVLTVHPQGRQFLINS